MTLSSFCSHRGPYCFACLRASVLWRHKGAAAHSAGSIQSSPRQANGFIHGNPTWRLFCALKDGVAIGIQKWIHSLFALKWERRTGLKFRLLSQNISQLQITYVIPAPHPAAVEPQPGAVLSLPREKTQQIFMGGDWVSTGGTGPVSHLHTLCPEPASKVKCRPKYCLFPATSELHPS